MDPIPLSDAVNELREELQQALKQADNRLRLGVKEIELELTLDFSKQQSGGLKLSVASLLGADLSANNTAGHLHRVKLTLNPVMDPPDGGDPGMLNLSAPERVDEPW
jgi:hypothetical protein